MCHVHRNAPRSGWGINVPRIFPRDRPRSCTWVSRERYRDSTGKRRRGAEKKEHPVGHTQEMLVEGLGKMCFRSSEALEILGVINDGVELIDRALCGLFELGCQM